MSVSAEEDVMLDVSVETESPDGQRKLKRRHKHKKHKRKKEKEDDANSPKTVSPNKPALKLKFKIGGCTLGEKSVSKDTISVKHPPVSQELVIDELNDPVDVEWLETDNNEVDVDVEKIVELTQSDEEEKWLDALEAGELDDFGELKRMKDPNLLTARQRSLLQKQKEANERDLEEVLITKSNEMKYGEVTQEQLEKRAQRAQRRKQMADEKKEKDKKQTIDRLLKKQDGRQKGGKVKVSKKSDIPMISYRNSLNSITMSLPPGVEFPLKQQVANTDPPKIQLCSVDGCPNRKKYTCSKTALPLCSFECYKKNLEIHKLVTTSAVT